MPNECHYLHCLKDATERRDMWIPKIDDRAWVVELCRDHAGSVDAGLPLAIYAYGVSTQEGLGHS